MPGELQDFSVNLCPNCRRVRIDLRQVEVGRDEKYWAVLEDRLEDQTLEVLSRHSSQIGIAEIADEGIRRSGVVRHRLGALGKLDVITLA